MKRFCNVLFLMAVSFAVIFSVLGCTDISDSESDGDVSSGTGGDSSGTNSTDDSIILHAQYPYIYVWESGISKLDKKTSGMKVEEDGWYYFEIRASSAMVIFKPNADDWDGQTDNLYATAGEWWYDGNDLSDTKPSGGSSSGSGSSGTTPTTLSAPTGLYATAASSSSIRLTWNSVSGATKYYVSQSEYASFALSDSYSTTSTSMTVTGLKANTKYYFRVSAANSTTTSDYSASDYATTQKTSSSGGGSSGTTPTTLSAPTGLTASEDSSSRIRLSWNSVSGATGYEVYCSRFSSTSYASLITTTTSTSAIISGNSANTIYYFWVKAINDTTKSDWSLYDVIMTEGSSSSQSRGTLKIINNSSHTIKDLMLYTADYDLSSLSGIESLSCTVYRGTTETVSNVYPGTYVEIGSKSYAGYKVRTCKTVVVERGSTTTLTITDSDIISSN